MIRTIFAQETNAEAYAQWDKIADTLRDRDDRLGALMDAGREDVLTYIKEHWAQIASTNPLERLNRACCAIPLSGSVDGGLLA